MKKAVAIFGVLVLLFTFVFANTFSVSAQPDISAQELVLEQETPTDAEEEESDEDIIYNDPPPIYSFTLEELAKLKLAYALLPENLFETYATHNEECGPAYIDTKEDAKKLIDSLECTTVILLDGDKESLEDMHIYVESGMTVGFIAIVEGERHIVCTSYSPYLHGDKEFEFDSADNDGFVNEITNGEVSAKVFNKDGEFWSFMKVNGTLITTRVWTATGEQTLEEFKAEFARFEFVEIGDMLKDYYIADSLKEIGVVLSRIGSLLSSFIDDVTAAFQMDSLYTLIDWLSSKNF